MIRLALFLVSFLLSACLSNGKGPKTVCMPSDSKTYPNLLVDSTSCSAPQDSLCLFASFIDSTTLSEADRIHLRSQGAGDGVRSVRAVTVNWDVLSLDTFFVNLAPGFSVLGLYKEGVLAAKDGAPTPYAGTLTLNVQDSLLTGQVQFNGTLYSIVSYTGLHVLVEVDLSCLNLED